MWGKATTIARADRTLVVVHKPEINNIYSNNDSINNNKITIAFLLILLLSCTRSLELMNWLAAFEQFGTRFDTIIGGMNRMVKVKDADIISTTGTIYPKYCTRR